MSDKNYMDEDVFVVNDFKDSGYAINPEGCNYIATYHEPVFSFFMQGLEDDYEFPITLAMWRSKFFYYFDYLETDQKVRILDKKAGVLFVLEEVSEYINEIKFGTLQSEYTQSTKEQPKAFLIAKLTRCLECMDTIVLNLDYFVSLI